MAKEQTDKMGDVLEELQYIKRLLVFALLRSGASQQEVAGALGVGQATISRMFAAAKPPKKPATSKKKGG